MAAVRNTIQRKLILQTVRQMTNHPTADEIYKKVVLSHPHISRATVYRNLTVLSDAGEILRVSHLNAADRFDFTVKPHYHFRCEECDSVFDVEIPYDETLLDRVQNPDGFEFKGCEITFFGVCSSCKNSGERALA